MLIKAILSSALVATLIHPIDYGNRQDGDFAAKTKCVDRPQQDMNICISKEYQDADHKLNEIYQELVQDLKQPMGIRNSERAWIKYRDAECSDDVMQMGQGSLYSYDKALCLLTLTNQRAKQLQWHLDNDCNGCPPRKEQESK